MEILYLWIKKFRIIDNQEFNFSSNWSFTYKDNKLEANYLLSENKGLVPSFFQLENYENQESRIKSITAIIGANGSGKSTLLEFLCLIFANGQMLFTSFDFILIAGNTEGEKDDFVIWHKENTKIENKAIFGKRVITIEPRKNWERWGLNGLNYIYYSNIFNDTNTIGHRGLINVSTRYLLDKCKSDYDNSSLKSQLEIFRINETLRDIEFILSHKEIDFPYKLPSTFSITFELSKQYYMVRDLKLEEGQGILDDMIRSARPQLFSNLKEDYNFNEVKQRFVENKHKYRNFDYFNLLLHWAVFLNFIESFYSVKDIFKLIFEDQRFYKNSILDWLIPFLEEIPENLEKGNNAGVKNSAKEPKLNKQIIYIKEFIEFVLNHKDLIESKVKFVNADISVSISGLEPKLDVSIVEEEEFVLSYINHYKRSIKNRGYCNFGWSNLSTGEQAYLSLFSRFFKSTKHKDFEKSSSNLLLIDEGELGFHPQWQKEYLFHLVTNVPKIFGRKTQIILASHSPFLVSDLPSGNIIFLNKDGIVVKKEEEQDFGGNIHKLFKDSFFLKGGLIGEFARKKIQATIDWINKKDANLEKKNNHYKIINMIGEPIVKQHLLEQYFNKIGLDNELEEIDIQIQELEEKRRQLKNKRKKDDTNNNE